MVDAPHPPHEQQRLPAYLYKTLRTDYVGTLRVLLIVLVVDLLEQRKARLTDRFFPAETNETTTIRVTDGNRDLCTSVHIQCRIHVM